ncbi:tripartite motif-containing protein 75-like [Leptodactylus fuscus]|uniref:tripartite motif-containing protein 75-like n=1 Tax=Leptodactylus fuscus TaxID=238119 RepID=UPI003F4F3B1A
MTTMTLKYELTCSICLDVYTCPVMLGCGHNFCRDCILQLIMQEPEVRYKSCPECRNPCSPEDLYRANFKLSNIAEYYKSLQDCHTTVKVPCTYCIHFPGTAVRTCLHCEASFCNKHLDVHSKSKEHVLVDPTTSPRSRKCRIHNEVFKYFCLQDQACICTSCSLVGEHQEHQVEFLEKASLSKKGQLKEVLESLRSELDICRGRRDVLRSTLKQKKENVAGLKKDLEAMFCNFREHLVNTHVSVTNEIGRQLGQVSKQISSEISFVDKRSSRLSLDLLHVQDVCSRMEPLIVLQDRVCRAYCDKRLSVEPNVDHILTAPVWDLDMLLISIISQKSLEGVVDHLPIFLSSKLVYLKYSINVLLNKATANNYLTVSTDLRSVTYSRGKLIREPRPDQFKTSQVLSITSFSSGKYFWEVKTSNTGVKAIGVAYPTIERTGLKAFIGYNEKSWCLIWGHDHIEVCHNSDSKQIASNDPAMRAVGVFLDYKAGLLSFYRLCAQVEHLYTFTTKFQEPLHAAFYVVDSWIKITPPPKKNPIVNKI